MCFKVQQLGKMEDEQILPDCLLKLQNEVQTCCGDFCMQFYSNEVKFKPFILIKVNSNGADNENSSPHVSCFSVKGT